MLNAVGKSTHREEFGRAALALSPGLQIWYKEPQETDDLFGYR
jgi:hypothetical protein